MFMFNAKESMTMNTRRIHMKARTQPHSLSCGANVYLSSMHVSDSTQQQKQ
jgi:hypothetical protein